MNKKETYPLQAYEYKMVCDDHYLGSRAEMKAQFKKTEMQRQLQLYLDRKNWRKIDPLSEWFLQSRDRLAIFHLFNLQDYSDGLSVGQVSRALKLPRTTTSRLLMECYQKRFILKNPEEGKSRFYIPSEHLLRNGDYWCEYFIDTTLSIEGYAQRGMFFDLKRLEYRTRQYRGCCKRNVTGGDVEKQKQAS